MSREGGESDEVEVAAWLSTIAEKSGGGGEALHAGTLILQALF